MRDSETTPGAPRQQSGGLALGDRLRSARKARALSVAQVAEALRLEESTVLALEEERFDALGAPVFVRGHLRRYAQLVGLSEEAMLDAYRGIVPDSEELPTFSRPHGQAEGIRVGAWAYWLAAALVLLGIVISLVTDQGAEPPAPAGESVIIPSDAPPPQSDTPPPPPAPLPEN